MIIRSSMTVINMSMSDMEVSKLEVEILSKRRELRNLIDRADAKRRDLNFLVSDVERETRELRLLEKTFSAKVLVDKAEEDGKLEEIKRLDVDGLKKVFSSLWNEDIEILHAELNKIKE
jgi:hypothetical protein